MAAAVICQWWLWWQHRWRREAYFHGSQSALLLNDITPCHGSWVDTYRLGDHKQLSAHCAGEVGRGGSD
jgi:hypothetical protein